MTGAVAPGFGLTETSLASRMGLSRGTIRSALLRLVTEGLVVQRPDARWEVASLTSTDAWATSRAALQALAARLAAETIDEDKGPVLEKAFDRLKAAADFDDAKAITDADLALHKTIVSMSGHHRLVDQYALVEQQVRDVYRLDECPVLRDRGRPGRTGA